MNPYTRLTPINEIKVIQVIEVKSLIGDGTKDSPIAEVTEYYSLDGIRLARRNYNDKLENGVWLEKTL
jgi:hypothetical protein